MAQVDLYQYINEIKGMLNGQRYAEASVHCQHILKSYPRHVEIYRLFASALLARQMHTDAADLYQRILSVDPADFNAVVSMAKIAHAQKRYEGAIRYLELAVDLDPYNHSLKQRLRDLSRAAKQKRVIPSMSRAALGILHFRSRLYRQTIQELTAVLAEQPQRLDLWQYLAEAYWRSEKNVEAVNACEQILAQLPDCIKANAILAETWLRTDKIAGAQKHLRLVQALTLPAQNHVEPDEPQGRAFLTRDSIEIPKQIRVDYLEGVEVDEEPHLYEEEDEWGTDIFYVEDLGLLQEEEAAAEEQAVEVDFFALLESAEAEEVFAFDEEAAEGDFETADHSGSWLSSATDSAPLPEDELLGEPEVDSGLLVDAQTGALGDMPDWLTEMDEEEAEMEPGSVTPDEEEVPAWLGETGELRDPFDNENAPSWLEEVTSEHEKPHTDLFMTDEELAGLWQYEEGQEEVPAADDAGEEDSLPFLEEDDEEAETESSPLSGGEPSLMDSFGFGDQPAEEDESFSFLDNVQEDDDGTGDGFSDWMSATGEVTVDDDFLAGLDEFTEGEEVSGVDTAGDEADDGADDLFAFLEEAEADSGLAAAEEDDLFAAEEDDLLEDEFAWLSDEDEETDSDSADSISAEIPSDAEEGSEDELASFAFEAAGEDELTAEEAEEAAEDELDFAFLDEADEGDSEELQQQQEEDAAEEPVGEDDETFSELTPEWLSDLSDDDEEKDASILSNSQTSRLLMPEGEDAPEWLTETAGLEPQADDSIELLDLDNTLDDEDELERDDIAWLADLEEDAPDDSDADFALDDSWVAESLTDEHEAPDWLQAFDEMTDASETADDGFDIASDDEVELPDWLSSGTGGLETVADEIEGADEEDDQLLEMSTGDDEHAGEEVTAVEALFADLDEEDEPAKEELEAAEELFDALDEEEADEDEPAADDDDWLAEFAAVEEDEEEGEDESPEWLAAMSAADAENEDEPEAAEEPLASDDVSEQEMTDATIPDWLSDNSLFDEEAAYGSLTAADSAEQVEADTEDDLGLPDWLRGTVEEDANTIDTGTLKALHDWEFSSSQREAATQPDHDADQAASDEDVEDEFTTSILPPLPGIEEAPPPNDDLFLQNRAEDEKDELRLSGWLDEVNSDQQELEKSDEVEFDKLDSEENDVTKEVDEEIETGPVDWLTGLPAAESSVGADSESADVADAEEDEQQVTDWLTGEIVAREERPLDLAESDDLADEEVPDWVQSIAAQLDEAEAEQAETESDDLFGLMADDEEDDDSEALSWMADMADETADETADEGSDQVLEAAEFEDDEFVDHLASLGSEPDAAVESGEDLDSSLAFWEEDEEEEEALPWLEADAAAADEQDQADEALAFLWDEAQEADDEDVPAEDDALPEWLDGMLDSLPAEDGGEETAVEDLIPSDLDMVDMDESEDVATEDVATEDVATEDDVVVEEEAAAAAWLADNGADMLDEPDEKLDELAQGLAELAADTDEDEPTDEFDERPLAPVGDEWLANNEKLDSDTWLGEEAVTLDVPEMEQPERSADEAIDGIGEPETPAWLMEEMTVEDTDEVESTQPMPTQPISKPAESQTSPEELEDVLSWLETLALQSDDE